MGAIQGIGVDVVDVKRMKIVLDDTRSIPHQKAVHGSRSRLLRCEEKSP